MNCRTAQEAATQPKSHTYRGGSANIILYIPMFSELTRNALVCYALLYPRAQTAAPMTCTPRNTALLRPRAPPTFGAVSLDKVLLFESINTCSKTYPPLLTFFSRFLRSTHQLQPLTCPVAPQHSAALTLQGNIWACGHTYIALCTA